MSFKASEEDPKVVQLVKDLTRVTIIIRYLPVIEMVGDRVGKIVGTDVGVTLDATARICVDVFVGVSICAAVGETTLLAKE